MGPPDCTGRRRRQVTRRGGSWNRDGDAGSHELGAKVVDPSEWQSPLGAKARVILP